MLACQSNLAGERVELSSRLLAFHFLTRFHFCHPSSTKRRAPLLFAAHRHTPASRQRARPHCLLHAITPAAATRIHRRRLAFIGLDSHSSKTTRILRRRLFLQTNQLSTRIHAVRLSDSGRRTRLESSIRDTAMVRTGRFEGEEGRGLPQVSHINPNLAFHQV